jgi:Family of unknown function (DUF6236)
VAEGVLYFPAISVPESEWFRRAVLYWDTVGTIVPFLDIESQPAVRPFTADLIQAELLQNVLPDDWIYQIDVGDYFKPFVKLIASDATIMTGAPLEQRETVLIHSGKTGTGLMHELEELDLANFVEGEEWDGWYDVEVNAGNMLMAYLASLLAQRENEPLDPITDSEECLQAFTRLPAPDAQELVAVTDSIRTVFLEGILPAPADDIDVAGLSAFKERYGPQLTRLRTDVEKRVIAAAQIADPAHRARQLEMDRRDLVEARDEIAARMSESKWRVAFGSLGGAIAGAMLLADATVTGGALAIGGNSLGLAGAVYAAFEGKRSKEQVLRGAMAYAALAQSAAARTRPFVPTRRDRLRRYLPHR